MANASTAIVPNETSVSTDEESYEEHNTYPVNDPAETSQRRTTSDKEYLRVQLAANRSSDSVSVTVHAGITRRTERIVRANKRLARMHSPSR